jgi:hypothetical protein
MLVHLLVQAEYAYLPSGYKIGGCAIVCLEPKQEKIVNINRDI